MTDQTPAPAPVVVHGNPNVPAVHAAVRLSIVAAGAFVAALGFPELGDRIDDYVTYAGPVAAAIAFGWGIIATRKAAKKSKILAVTSPLGDIK